MAGSLVREFAAEAGIVVVENTKFINVALIEKKLEEAKKKYKEIQEMRLRDCGTAQNLKLGEMKAYRELLEAAKNEKK